ncbi:shikimate kinase [Candidatus Azobacteroides pseudotrichonymphae]|uniref:Shikimate kinase n=1 Tax=Azobacteroides pseudotrichonymphae genomovar. CFP2 TaxID=511995 RepID=AROK_AZOPC|nr:shikimate kinase [Candidatus Azobacteroides pseudotrichonymphae]B6YQJ0.1 RecName: Full=Shikimate kinase; Short=SK [Candidatus Azobacteroides pseudotrichonymphae genomovar. CFP2]BAG83462.1 shikimate kinase [Candidatus Azobacteroides pseudotrichonymphae genomovar. CFP2]
MRRIFLIGYMGAGKTTIGKILAEKLNLSFIDTDFFIKNRYKKEITDIFAGEGEEKFRRIEQKILQEIIQKWENIVISTGGGTPCFFHNMELMNASGTTVYLKATIELLTERLINMKCARPLIKDKSPEEIKYFVINNLVKRELFYNQASIVFFIKKMTMNDIIENLMPKI